MTQIINKAGIIHRICELLADNKRNESVDYANDNYPFVVIEKLQSRKYSKYEMMKVFLRDGFIDRYSGERLIFPGLIRLLTLEIPDIFRYHINWKMTETHMIYWDLFPTIDHIIPIARGGSNSEDNWITTSQLRNSAKSNFTIEELGWVILPNGNTEDWDGLCTFFLQWLREGNLEEKYKHKEEWRYITEWREALLKIKESATNKKVAGSTSKEKNIITRVQDNDIKNLPVGTISRNKKTQNKYVTLKDGQDGFKIYSSSENLVMTINTKELLVDIEFKPEKIVSSIVELPNDIYSLEQLELIKKACKRLCNGNYKNLAPKELPLNTIYQYLLK